MVTSLAKAWEIERQEWDKLRCERVVRFPHRGLIEFRQTGVKRRGNKAPFAGSLLRFGQEGRHGHFGKASRNENGVVSTCTWNIHCPASSPIRESCGIHMHMEHSRGGEKVFRGIFHFFLY